MFQGLTAGAGPQTVRTGLGGLRELVVRTEELLIVAVFWVARGVVHTGIFCGSRIIQLAVR